MLQLDEHLKSGEWTLEDDADLITMLWDPYHAGVTPTCPECHLWGIGGFIHANMEGVVCYGLGGLPVKMEDVQALWPERLPPA